MKSIDATRILSLGCVTAVTCGPIVGQKIEAGFPTRGLYPTAERELRLSCRASRASAHTARSSPAKRPRDR